MNAVRKTSLAVSALILALYLYVYVFNGIMRIPIPFMRNYGENTILVSSWALATGRGLYRWSELTSVPAIISPYSPIGYLLFAACIKVWGITYAPGRLIMFVAMFGCVGMIIAISIRIGISRIPSVVGGLLFLAPYPVTLWSAMYRMDFLALLFELIAVFLLLKERNSIWRSAAFVIAGVLAGYTKQHNFMLVVGALLGLFLFGDKARRKQLVFLGAAYAATAVVVLVVLELVTHGSFHKSVIGSFRSLAYWRTQLDETIKMLKDPITSCVIILGAIGVSLDKKYRWVATSMVFGFVIALRLILIRGGSVNYYFEPLAACCIGVAALFDHVEYIVKDRDWPTVILCGCLSLCLIGSGYLRKSYDYLYWPWEYVDVYRSNSKPSYIISRLKSLCPPGGLILADYSDRPLFADCVPVMSDPYLLTLMAEDGKWDPSPVVNALREKRVAVVMLKEKLSYPEPMLFLPRDVARAVIENYEQAPIVSIFSIYVPKKDQPAVVK